MDQAHRVAAALPREVGAVLLSSGRSTILAAAPEEVVEASGPDALKALVGLAPGWWAGFLSYDLGRATEPFPTLNPPDPILPDLLLARFGARLEMRPGHGPSPAGGGAGLAILRDALSSAVAPGAHRPLTGWETSMTREAWEAAVRTIHDHLRAGDCYQVNLTRRLTCPMTTDGVALSAALARANPAPHAAWVRLGEVEVVSASPESYLRGDGSTIETRPIKGTAADPELLARSLKDRAENVMIVDLARNDLGRVCVPGTVTVPSLMQVEAHPGLYHLVSTVRGRLRDGATVAEIVRATFPPASVTGCPKPAVLSIIEQLEPVRRGVYCGAVGWIDTRTRAMDLNVAIRTFTMAGGVTSFGVGGGIVADSDPGEEWAETELKAGRLLAVAAGQTSR
ncbi:MAG TPA: chorismate-binding protein [Actinomycetota bacterium]|nr:chorismate-binding protein [Actinomycetota bacterium]